MFSESSNASRTFQSPLFTQILEAVPFGLLVLDSNGATVYSNSRAAEIVPRGISGGATSATFSESRSAYLAGTDTVYPVDRMPIIRALSGETSTVSDIEIRNDGVVRYLEVSGAPVLDTNKRVKYAVSVFHDITATRAVEAALRVLAGELAARARERSEQLEEMRRSLLAGDEPARPLQDRPSRPAESISLIEPCGKCWLYEELEKTRESAELANRALTLFIANFSHELRTPLNHIIGFSDLIENKLQRGVTVDVENHARNIRASGASLLDTLDKIITVAETESIELRLSLEILDVSPILRDVVARNTPLADSNGNRLELEIIGELGMVQTDATRLRVALEQIVENACKHCRDGSVTVTASRNGSGTAGSIDIVVSDTGRGIDPVRAKRLIEGRVAPGDPLLNAGLGIGIPLAVQSLRALGGSLKFTTEVGVGTSFVLAIPTYSRFCQNSAS